MLNYVRIFQRIIIATENSVSIFMKKMKYLEKWFILVNLSHLNAIKYNSAGKIFSYIFWRDFVAFSCKDLPLVPSLAYYLHSLLGKYIYQVMVPSEI